MSGIGWAEACLFEKVVTAEKPHLVVVGDVNSTLACALVAEEKFLILTDLQRVRAREGQQK